MSYKVRLEIFEGPLDLLLYLVKKDHLNIYDIPIAQISEQYLKYLELMRMLDLNIAGEFLVMAATLMQIKSKMLLPAEETQPAEEEEDPRAELVRRLLEYEKYKEVAESLRQREAAQQDVFKRPRSELNKVETTAGGEVYFEASIFDLINAFTKALDEVPKELFYQVIKDEFTIEGKVHEMLHLMMVESHKRVAELFVKCNGKIEIIVTFLAILELIRLKEIVIIQKGLFGEIEIMRNDENIIPYDQRNKAEIN
ncbi:MAG: segregation/condensation protein A [Candidatus Omnitrophota bacterium]|jgi:segregation and condensation protein A